MKSSSRIQTIRRWHITVGVLVAGVLAAMPPKSVLATPLVFDISASVGPIAVQLNITNPVEQSTGLFRSTLHMHIRDETQTPAFNGDLVAIGNAADSDTLLGGFLPAAMIVKKDLLAGMTFEQAAADAQTKTGVTVTFFNDPTAIEYAVMLALIIVVVIHSYATVSPLFHNDGCDINSTLMAGLAAGGFQQPPDPCLIP